MPEPSIDYAQTLKELREGSTNASKSFDRTFVLLSSGALSLSIVFLTNIVKGDPVAPCLIYSAWIAFAVALCSILLSVLFSQLGFDKEMNKLSEAAVRATKEGRASIPGSYVPNGNWLILCAKIALAAALVAFFLGVITFLTFAIINTA